jgi:hypothetical protein
MLVQGEPIWTIATRAANAAHDIKGIFKNEGRIKRGADSGQQPQPPQ